MALRKWLETWGGLSAAVEQEYAERGGFSVRMPIRWRWSMLVGLSVTVAVVVLFFVIMNIERAAWLQSQAAQAEIQVDRLTDELKLPLLSGSSAETDIVIQSFLEKVPTVLGVLIKYPDGKVKPYGTVSTDSQLLRALPRGSLVTRLPVKDLWYAKKVVYANTPMGTVAVRFSEKDWENIAGQLVQQIFLAAVVVVIASGVLVFWVSGRISRPIEMLGDAAAKVADGDYDINLPVSGDDEISDALTQFNMMARELAHKEELRDVFGRYLNPKLVDDVFESGDVDVESRRQQVTVLFADMVGFTPFSESTDTQVVVHVLNRHFEVFHRIITYYGGHVDKYIGDAVMAVFNHPVTELDHARHAAKSALAMAMACDKLNMKQPNGQAIQFRLGLNCGYVIVGNIGAAKRLEYTVIGDAVNVASRMGGIGAGGELVMPRETFEMLGDGFAFEPIEGCHVKGVSQDIEVGRVSVTSAEVAAHLAEVVELAFDLDRPSELREDIERA